MPKKFRRKWLCLYDDLDQGDKLRVTVEADGVYIGNFLGFDCYNGKWYLMIRDGKSTRSFHTPTISEVKRLS